jgi:hypothetical protein
MPKRTKKLVLYLDQNFISETAKGPINERVKREFSKIYEICRGKARGSTISDTRR